MASWISLTPAGQKAVSSAKNILKSYNEAKQDKNVTDALNKAYYYDPIYKTTIGNAKATNDVAKNISAALVDNNNSQRVALSGSGSSGSGSSGLSSGFTTLSNGKVGFADSSMQSAADMINQTAESNNAWAAEQAQKQMDFQREMSDTAHQREVKDLQAAGLNPVLSAGGSGASTPTGAMAQPDTSNTRLIAELAYSAINGLANTASGYATASKMEAGEGLFGKLSQVYKQNPLVKQIVNTALSTVGGTTKYVAARAFYKSMFK